MSAHIYLEGGGSKELDIRCREGFRKLLESCGFGQQRRMPRLFACGGRASAYDDFVTAHVNSGEGYVAMWIDSEEPITNIENAWTHLATVTNVQRWNRPVGANDDQVLFMTTCMESLIVADRETLRQEFGAALQESALPPLINLEQRSRHDVQNGLLHATRNCSKQYSKGKLSFIILGNLVPATLEEHLPSFRRVRRVLRDKL